MDLRLVRRALAGDPLARNEFAERLCCIPSFLVAQHRSMGRPLRDVDLEDLQQEVAATVWKKAAQFEGRSTLETWVYPFCTHKLRNEIRRAARLPSQLDDGGLDLECLGATPPDRAAEDYESLDRELGRLPPPLSRVVRLRACLDLTFAEISHAVEAGESTVKSRYYRSISRLRQGLAGPAARLRSTARSG